MSHIEINMQPGPGTNSSAESIQRQGVVGTWFNTNRASSEIARVDLTYGADDWMIRAYSVEHGATNDWGEVRLAPHVSPDRPREMIGFEARFESETVERHLAANLKYGVLVIQCYKHVKGSGAGAGHFTREFFHQRIEDSSEPGGDGEKDSALHGAQAGDWLANSADTPTGGADLTPYLGTWRNTWRHTRGISHLALLRDGDGFLVHAHGVASDRPWGAVSAWAYADNVGSPDPSGFFATYDFEFKEMRLAANFNKGLLIVAAYNRFHDNSGRADYFTREFFYHEQPSG